MILVRNTFFENLTIPLFEIKGFKHNKIRIKHFFSEIIFDNFLLNFYPLNIS